MSSRARSGTPILSVVIPVRNGMPYIEEALASVLRSESSDIEVIVAENFSTDGTAEWLMNQEDSRLKVVKAETPLSAAANWTVACELARGRWVKLLCADDYLIDGGLDRQLAAAQANPDAAVIASRRRVVSDAGRTVIARHGLGGFIGRIAGDCALRRAILSGYNPFGEPSSVIFRSDALKESLPFRDEHPYLTDLDMYIRALTHGPFVGLDTVDAIFRLSTSSWSASIGKNQLAEHKAWLASLERQGIIRMSRTERFSCNSRLRARFLVRRGVTAAAGLFGGKA